MKNFIAYYLQMFVAFLAVPVLKLTGYRFSKAWRGNPIIAHVQANMMADGVMPARMKFFNKYL